MNVILEGPDCAGKTTLRQRAFLGHIDFHNGVWDYPFQSYLSQATEVLSYPNLHYVWDRFWFSNLVYAPVTGDCPISLRQHRLLHDMTVACGAILVVCLPDLDWCLVQWQRRKEDELVQEEEKYRAIWQRYHQDTFDYPYYLKVDPTRMSGENIRDIVEEVSKGVRHAGV